MARTVGMSIRRGASGVTRYSKEREGRNNLRQAQKERKEGSQRENGNVAVSIGADDTIAKG
jgi:hypothetical protein